MAKHNINSHDSFCGVTLLDVDYFQIDLINKKTFTLYIKIEVDNKNKEKLELFQGIISLKGIYKGHIFMYINNSILFIGDGDNDNSSIYHCYCENLPLSLHNYITINEENYNDIDILNYYLNVQFIGSLDNNIPSIVLEKNFKLNLNHNSFTNTLPDLDTKEYIYNEFNCFKQYQVMQKIFSKENNDTVSVDDLKKNLISIVQTGKLPISDFQNEPSLNLNIVSSSSEINDEKQQQLYNIKTANQTISIKLNYPVYPICAKSLIISINSSELDLLSGVSVQLYKTTKLATTKISQKLDKFTLFADTTQQSILMNLPIAIEQPTVVDEMEYKLLVKFVEPFLNDKDNLDMGIAKKNLYFNNSKEMKHGFKYMLSPEMTGTLGVCYIPIVFKR
ncbi:hypothetical protein HANVADRAFT_589 [Hanseniaspora valbyensis NRRL Y-1626]|uniref:Uncharacterized protein n=1 Tax=Hanseniaspora valbyensis NRRL Y-1626 TaxID=766949 RepID=A0A1B7TI72_9ASCO|nr:hypothetical protein HANVADRAFT_589 [Hanseniaspora valbyensis NRRL Y-1626]